jgi:hypothetical protein
LSLVREGYARLPRFVSADELPLLRAAAASQEGDADGCARPNNTLLPLSRDAPAEFAI